MSGGSEWDSESGNESGRYRIVSVLRVGEVRSCIITIITTCLYFIVVNLFLTRGSLIDELSLPIDLSNKRRIFDDIQVGIELVN